MESYEYMDLIWQIAKTKIGKRKLAIWNLSKEKEDLLLKNIRRNYQGSVMVCVSNREGNTGEQKDNTIDSCINKPKEYYILIWGKYTESINRQLQEHSYMEITDYIYKIPKAVKLNGTVRFYSDESGTIIKNLPANLNIVLRGYGSYIEFGQNVTFGINSEMFLDHRVTCKIDTNSKFGNDTRIELNDFSECVLENSQYGSFTKIHAAKKASIKVGKDSTFGEQNELIANIFCQLKIGEDVMVSRKCVMRAGDGHALFYVLTGERKNFLSDKKAENQTIIGNHVWICYDGKVLSPSVIGSGCTIGTNSIAKGTYPNNCVLAGSIAKVVRKNSAWARNPIAEDMQVSCGNSYAIPTIEKQKFSEEAMKFFCGITDIYQYLNLVLQLKNKLFIIAVRDTPGFAFNEEIWNLMKKMGLKEDLRDKHWHGYIAILDENQVLYESLGG